MGSIRHVFTNNVADGTNTNLVRPSDWNSQHAYTMQDAVSLGGNTAGVMALISSGLLLLAGGSNVTLSQNGNSVTVSAASAPALPVFSNSNGVSFGTNAGTVTATVATNYQSQGAYLTTADLSQNSSKYAGTGFTTTTVAGAVVAGTHDTAGLKLAVPAFLTTAQPVGAYLTTARGSTDAIGLATAKTNVTWTANSAGLSLDAGAYLTTAMQSNAQTLSNIKVSGGTTSNLLSALTFGDAGGVSFGLNGSVLTAVAPAGAPSPINFSAGTTSSNIGSVVFSNSNGVSFGLNGSTITGTVATNYQSQGAYLTTAALSQDSSKYAATGFTTTTVAGAVVAGTHDTAGLKLAVPAFLTTAQPVGAYLTTAALSQDSSKYAGVGESVGTVGGTDLAMTVNTDGVSILYPKWLTTAQPVGAYLTTARASNDAIGLNTALTANGVSWTANSSGLSLNVPAFLTTAMQSNAATISNVKMSAGATSGTRSDFTFADSNGISFGYSTNGVITATVATNYQAPGAYLTTAMASNRGSDFVQATAAFAGTNISGTIASNGLSLSAAAPGGGANLSLQDSATTLQVTKAIFSNANGVSFGLATAASLATVTASVAAQSNQTVGLYATGNTTNNSSTTFDARTLGTWNAQGALTAGFSNGSIQLSVPATSSLVGANGASISSAGSTISVQLIPMSYTMNNNALTIAGSNQANSSVSLVPFDIDWPLAMSEARVLASISVASTTNVSSASQAYSLSVVLYTRNGSTLNSVWSGKQNSNSFWQSNSTTALAGVRALVATGVATTLPPDRYYAAVHLSTTNSGTGGATTALGASYSMIVGNSFGTGAIQADPWNGGATNQSRAFFHGLGLFSTNSTMASIALTNAAFTHTGNSASLANLGVNLRNWSLF